MEFKQQAGPQKFKLQLKWLVIKWIFLVVTGLLLFMLGLEHGLNSQGKPSNIANPK